MNDKLADEPEENAEILKAAADLLGDRISKQIDALQSAGCHGCHCHCHCYHHWCYPWPVHPYTPTVTWVNTTGTNTLPMNTVTFT
jgi:hypothetical protein